MNKEKQKLPIGDTDFIELECLYHGRKHIVSVSRIQNFHDSNTKFKQGSTIIMKQKDVIFDVVETPEEICDLIRLVKTKG